MQPFSWLTFCFLFAVYTVTDALYTRWMYQVSARKAFPASITAMILAACIAVGVMHYTQNHWYIISVILGSGFGTWWEVKKEQNRFDSEAV